jgi:SAM-dependent methyltransferase
MSDTWDDGATYEPYIGRWSRVVAQHFVDWLALPQGAAWLDFGCGTGALSQTILARANPRVVIGCDRSPGYIAYAQSQTSDARVRFGLAELPELPRIAGGFDAAVAALVLNFLPVPLEGVLAMRARVKPGGTVAAYVWDCAERMELIRCFWDAANELDETARPLDEAVRFPLCRPEPLALPFLVAELRDVVVRSIEVPTVFRDFDDYWTPFLGGQGPAPGYVQSLTPDRQAELRETIRGRLGRAADGTIALTARAWAVKGIVA